MHLFKKNIGTSVHQYHLILRMEHAKKNLAAKDFSVAEVASMSGFDDPLYFSRIFKKITGMSPKEFQKAQKS
jgi:AraC-like DNA-binding protein